MAEVTGDRYGYPLIPTDTIVGREIQEYCSDGDELYATIVSYTDSDGDTTPVSENIILKFKRYHKNTSTNITEEDIEAVLFEDLDIFEVILGGDEPAGGIRFDLHRIVRENGTEYEFDEIGQLKSGSGASANQGGDTEIYDP